MIIFNDVEFKNFLSVGDNSIKLILDKSPTTLVTGKNGDGKSTVLDAMTFCLFGKSYRGINKDKLINTINKKDCVVSMKITVGKEIWKVTRGIKPNFLVIEKNGVVLDTLASVNEQQDFIEQSILGFGFKSFCQTCILSTMDYVPFMKLTTSQRREFIESLFGINVFSTMNTLLKSKVNAWKTNVTTNSNQIELVESKISMQSEFIATLNNNNSQLIQQKKDSLNFMKENVIELQEKKAKIEEETLSRYGTEDTKTLAELIVKVKTEKATIDDIIRKIESSVYAKKVKKSELSDKKRDLHSHSDGSECPTCMQIISKEHVESCTAKIDVLIGDVESKMQDDSSRVLSQQTLAAERDTLISLLNSKKDEITNIDINIKQIAASAKSIVAEIKQLETMKESSSDISTEKNKLDLLKAQLQLLNEERKSLMSKEDTFKIALNMMKDTGIKSMVIKQYLPLLNQRVNYYLDCMNFNVSFMLDEEFNETIVSRNRTDFSYSNFSAGERQRIDLALIFAWRDVAAMKNSVNTNLLMLDEIGDSSLDSVGVEDLITIIEGLKNSNVFIVSHRGNFEDKVRSIIKVEKFNGFTKIA